MDLDPAYEKLNWFEVRDLFRTWREENHRKSKTVVDLWELILQGEEHKLGDEKYLVLEQVCLAAADVNRLDIIDQCLYSLHKEFPGSLRVKRLQVLKLELAEKFDEALKFLDELCKVDETNAALRKKKIAILKSKGNVTEAIKELTEYLKKFMSDEEAWQELSELYLSEEEFAKAAFCMEEIILISPHNHLYHQRYAEIKYTQGGFDNLEIARSHYCLALKLSPNNMRALYGVFLCAANIALHQKTQSQKKRESHKLAAWALKQIEKKYSEAEVDKSCVSSLEGLMNSRKVVLKNRRCQLAFKQENLPEERIIRGRMPHFEQDQTVGGPHVAPWRFGQYLIVHRSQFPGSYASFRQPPETYCEEPKVKTLEKKSFHWLTKRVLLFSITFKSFGSDRYRNTEASDRKHMCDLRSSSDDCL